jgi:prepilin-type N-terminal cleavage/methylation domain-containing protein
MHKRGFTLMEIIIVVTIISLLAAIAIPNLLRARISANESAAIAALKALTSAAITFQSTHSDYPANLSALIAESPPYIDSVLASGTKQGYNFNFTGYTYAFEATANPVTFGMTGRRYFFVDESGVLRYNETGAATNTSPTVE